MSAIELLKATVVSKIVTRSISKLPRSSASFPRRSIRSPHFSSHIRGQLSPVSQSSARCFSSNAFLRDRHPQPTRWEPRLPSQGPQRGNYYENPEPEPQRRSGSYRPILLLAGGGAVVFYFMNLETVPVSGRRRFNCYSEASAEKQGLMAYQQIVTQSRYSGSLVPENDPRVKQVKRVLDRLIEGGKLGSGNSGDVSSWEVNVIDQDEANAFVLPGGKVFVYTGILPITQDDEGLATVLGHEIAHNLAHHSAERMSGAIVVQLLAWTAILAEQAFLGGNGQLSQMLANVLLDFGIMRPSSRQQESEADYIGLLLMAESCYDPEAAVGLWQRMEAAQKGAPPEWLSTHPSNASRIQHITEWMPKAEEKRFESGCAATIGYQKGFQEAVGSFW